MLPFRTPSLACAPSKTEFTVQPPVIAASLEDKRRASPSLGRAEFRVVEEEESIRQPVAGSPSTSMWASAQKSTQHASPKACYTAHELITITSPSCQLLLE